ncbi:MAG TPA: hypothetical protein VK147_01640 [Candidatus Didemnitutus sp.]|nr:hypothetical protein [Candidatus Didemnitutus sp.]
MTLQTFSRFIIAFLCCQLIGVAVLYGQWTDIAPAWSVQAESGAHVRVADSVVVVATKDSVVVFEASTGVRRFAWKPGVEIGGLALETHREGIVLSTLRFLPAQTMVLFHSYTYGGMLRETDSFEVQRPFDSSKFIDGINAISTSGRYIVFASQQICDRVSKNVVNARGYSVKSVSFNYDETACALMYGGRTYGNHGETVLKHESRLFSLDPLTSGEIFLPGRTIDRLAQFIPGTNLLWNGSEAFSFPDWKVVRKMSHGPYGSLADDGYRSSTYEATGANHSVVIRGYKDDITYRLPYSSVYEPLRFDKPWYETTRALKVIALPGDTIRVFVIPDTDLRPALNWVYIPNPFLEHTPLRLSLGYIPATATFRLTLRIDDAIHDPHLLHLNSGEHRMQVELLNGDSVVDKLDTTFEVKERKRTKHSIWVGEGSGSTDLSPSGDHIVVGGDEIYLVDVIRDTLFQIKGDPQSSEWRARPRFISDRTLLLTNEFVTGSGPSGGLPGRYYHGQSHLALNLTTGSVQRGAFGLNRYDNEPAPVYTGAIDRRRGRGLFYTGGFNGDSNSVVWVVTDTALTSERPCFYSPRYVAVDPSTDRPLLIGTLTINAPQTRTSRRIDGQSRACLELIGLPAIPMMFVHDGKILWSRDGTYNSQTGLKINAASLQENCIAVPHSSLVLCPVAQPQSSPTDLVFYSALDARPLATVHYGTSIGTIICDTSGRRLLITRGYPAELEVLDLESIIKDNGLEQYYLDSPTSVSESDPAVLCAPRPNPASDIVRFDWPASREVLQIEVRDLMGVCKWNYFAAMGSTYIDWDLHTSSGQRVAPGMYGYLLRTIDGRILESGKFIVAHE